MIKKKRITEFWWLNPDKMMLRFVLPIFVILCFYPFRFAKGGMYDLPNYIDFKIFILGLLFFFFFHIGYFFSFRGIRKSNLTQREYISAGFLLTIGIISIVANIIWFSFLITDPTIFLKIVSRQGEEIFMAKSVYSTIPGITTLSQLGVLYVIIFQVNSNLIKPDMKLRLVLYIVLVLTVIRTIVWAERLALVEVILSIGVMYLRFGNISKLNKSVIRILHNAPYFGILALFLFFGIFEYFRSWRFYQNYYDNIVSFTIERVLLYYYGSVNTMAALLKMTNWPSYSFLSYIHWLYDFPVLGKYLQQIKPREPFGTSFMDFLSRYLDPEFNNLSGILAAYLDSGIIGTLLLAFLLGVISKYSYLGYRKGYGLGLYLFPLVFILVFDILRQPYFSQNRVFPIVLFAFIGYRFKRRIYFNGAKNDSN